MLDFVAIDFETANSYRGSPCAVGLVRVRDGRIAEQQRWLIRPPEQVDWFDDFNVWVHGIRPEMVQDAPRWNQILPDLVSFIGDDVVIAHNAGLDIGVLRYACAVDNIEWPQLRFLCTMVLARRALSLPSNSLPFVVEAVGAAMGEHHDPLADARGVVDVVCGLAAMHGAQSLEELSEAVQVRIGHMSAGVYKGSVSLVSSGSGALVRPDVNPDADPEGYLYNRVIVFTGKLMAMTRQIAWEECARVGALPDPNTTKRTNVLVIGDLNPASLRPGEALSEKARRAFDLKDKGQDIEVMTEDDFMRCFEGKSPDGIEILLASSGPSHRPRQRRTRCARFRYRNARPRNRRRSPVRYGANHRSPTKVARRKPATNPRCSGPRRSRPGVTTTSRRS